MHPVQSPRAERARRRDDQRQERAPMYLLHRPEHQGGMGEALGKLTVMGAHRRGGAMWRQRLDPVRRWFFTVVALW
jgi:hypothetical protein